MLTQQWVSAASLSPWQCNELRWVLLHWSIPIAIPRITAATQTCLNTCTNIDFHPFLYTTLSCGPSCILVLDNLVESQFMCTHSCSYCEGLKVSCLPWLRNCSRQWQLVFRQRWYGHVKSSCWGVDHKRVMVYSTWDTLGSEMGGWCTYIRTRVHLQTQQNSCPLTHWSVAALSYLLPKGAFTS